MTKKIADLLDEIGLFQEFSYAELEVLGRYLKLEEIIAGEMVFSEGERGNYMFILLSGRVAIFKGGLRHQHLLATEGRGRIIGEMSLLDQEARSASCVAEQNSEILTFTHQSLKKMAVEHPAVAFHFMLFLARLLSRRLRRTSGMVAEYMSELEELHTQEAAAADDETE